jgi:hypothetical protein
MRSGQSELFHMRDLLMRSGQSELIHMRDLPMRSGQGGFNKNLTITKQVGNN